jgi:hypothetical protein
VKEKIGETAGKVWQVLQEHGGMDVSRLTKLVRENEVLVHQAVGWLAREDKIDIHTKGPKTTIALKE